MGNRNFVDSKKTHWSTLVKLDTKRNTSDSVFYRLGVSSNEEAAEESTAEDR